MSLSQRAKQVAASEVDDGDLGFESAPEAIEAAPTTARAAASPKVRYDGGTPVHPARIEVEAVVGGCLMRLHLENMSPAGVLPWLKGIDPNCKVRDDFPAKGGGFGKRETKRARLKAINLKASPNGTFIDLVCKAEKAVSVTVSKKNADGFVAALAATGRVIEENLAELQGAIDAKGQATVMLDDTEAVDVEYWTSEDGKSFMEALHAGEVA